MKVTVEVTACSNCPFCQMPLDGVYLDYSCKYIGTIIKLKDVRTIPIWCPINNPCPINTK